MGVVQGRDALAGKIPPFVPCIAHPLAGCLWRQPSLQGRDVIYCLANDAAQFVVGQRWDGRRPSRRHVRAHSRSVTTGRTLIRDLSAKPRQLTVHALCLAEYKNCVIVEEWKVMRQIFASATARGAVTGWRAGADGLASPQRVGHRETPAGERQPALAAGQCADPVPQTRGRPLAPAAQLPSQAGHRGCRPVRVRRGVPRHVEADQVYQRVPGGHRVRRGCGCGGPRRDNPYSRGLWRKADDSASVVYNGELSGVRYRADLAGRKGWPLAARFMCAGCLGARARVWDHCHTHGFVRAPCVQYLQYPPMVWMAAPGRPRRPEHQP